MSDMQRAKILWLARAMPVPLSQGDRIYTARLADAIGRQADVEFLGLASPDGTGTPEGLLGNAVRWTIVPGAPTPRWRALLSREPLAGALCDTLSYRRVITERVATGSYDAIVLDHYGMAWALPVIDAALPPGPRPALVHVAHDFETEVTLAIARAFRGNPLRRLLLHRNAARAADAERRLAAGCDIVAALTDHDCAMFQTLDPTLARVTLPPGYDGPHEATRTINSSLPRRIVVLGSYRWIAKQMNLDAFLKETDAIFAAAGVECVVIGDVEPGFRAAWEARLKATRFLGFVDDLKATVADCRMGLVIEATGGGFKLKVLDYVFLRQPVAALAAGLGGQPEAVTRHFLIAPTAAELAHAIVTRIDDVAALNAMQNAAHAAAAPLFSWDRNAERLLTTIATVTSSAGDKA